MKHTITIVKPKTFEDKQTKQQITLIGYSFMDECGYCIIVVYGESAKNRMIKYLQ